VLYKDRRNLIMSEVRGQDFSASAASTGMHGDVHDVFLEAGQPEQLVRGDDGGLWISYDAPTSGGRLDNLPISQVLPTVRLDNADPTTSTAALQTTAPG